MRILLLLLALSACGDPVESFVGGYSLVGVDGSRTVNGQTTPFAAQGAPGAKLLITREANMYSSNVIKLTIGGQDFVEATVTSAATFDTIFRTASTMDGDCSCALAFDDGLGKSNGTLQKEVLEVALTGKLDCFCTMRADYSGTFKTTTQATKDR